MFIIPFPTLEQGEFLYATYYEYNNSIFLGLTSLRFAHHFRYWRTVKYGLRSRHDYAYYNMMIFEYRDISMLRLQEAFMESAPQLVLQVYIMLESKEFHWLTGKVFKGLITYLRYPLPISSRSLLKNFHAFFS